jgi:N-acetylmuramoyl-L-alanine amidase
MPIKPVSIGVPLKLISTILLFCLIYLSATAQTGTVSTYEIFGPKYQQVTVQSQELKGAVFYLVSGHGGPDPGAIGKYGNAQVSEDEYAYDVTLRLARKLIEKGALVYMITRDPNDGIRDDHVLKLDNDETCYPNQTIPLNQTQRLAQRTRAVNDLFRKYGRQYQRVIFIHLDSRSMGENIDVFFYHHPKSKSGKRLATRMRDTFKEKYALFQPNRKYTGTVSDRNLYVLRNTKPTALFIELGNIRNTQDQRRFILKDNREALAKWISEGLSADFRSR